MSNEFSTKSIAHAIWEVNGQYTGIMGMVLGRLAAAFLFDLTIFTSTPTQIISAMSSSLNHFMRDLIGNADNITLHIDNPHRAGGEMDDVSDRGTGYSLDSSSRWDSVAKQPIRTFRIRGDVPPTPPRSKGSMSPRRPRRSLSNEGI